MYGKLFESMFDGTLSESWEALIVFQQMIILSDANGVVDVTPSALHRRTGIPLDVIKKGIEVLESPDDASRTPSEEGRRIVRISNDRVWGWRIVNHSYYRGLSSRAEKLTRDRERQRRKRSEKSPDDRIESPSVADVASVASVADVAHADADADANANANAETSENTIARSAMFGEFWDCVHLKIGKRAAEKAFKRAIVHVRKEKRVTALAAGDSITSAMKRFAASSEASPKDRTAIHPTTWLNQGRYDDVLVDDAKEANRTTVDDWFESDEGDAT